MMRASKVFRECDQDHTGNLDHHEFNKALMKLHYNYPGVDKAYLFQLVDRDGSKRISEWEFVDFWAQHGFP